MKIVVIGGSGLIGSKLVALLRAGGHEVISAPSVSPRAATFAARSSRSIGREYPAPLAAGHRSPPDTELQDDTPVPGAGPRLGAIGFDEWRRRQADLAPRAVAA